MKRFFITLFMFVPLMTWAQKNEGLKAITMNGLQSKVAFLASDLMGGREAGEHSGFLASEYIATKFGELNLKPFNGKDNGILTKYMHPFGAIKITPKNATISIGNNKVKSTYKSGVDFEFTYPNENTIIVGKPILFDGTQSCEGKIAIIANADNSVMKKAMELGATAILSYNKAELKGGVSNKAFKYHYNEDMYEGTEPRKLFYDSKMVLDDAQFVVPVARISERMYEAIKTSSKINFNIKVCTDYKYLRNVIGYIEGEIKDEYVVIGSHYDHFGMYDGYIYNGADDNATGTAAVMQIAEAFIRSGEKPKRTVVFALWDGEERGLLGSKAYTRDIDYLGGIKGYLNFDMIGRNSNENDPQSVSYMYTESAPKYGKWLKEIIKEYKLGLKPSYSPWDNPISGSDNASFAKHGIPIAWFHTGGHPDYHQPSDHVDKINWDKLLDITRSSYLIFYNMANE